jgi:hypothetical protein
VTTLNKRLIPHPSVAALAVRGEGRVELAVAPVEDENVRVEQGGIPILVVFADPPPSALPPGAVRNLETAHNGR